MDGRPPAQRLVGRHVVLEPLNEPLREALRGACESCCPSR